jgi:hypothetical protein
MSAAEVAEIAFSGLMKRKTIIIPGFVNKLNEKGAVSRSPNPFFSLIFYGI